MDNPRMVGMSGAISMAPMITAVEFVINPSVAIRLESRMSRK